MMAISISIFPIVATGVMLLGSTIYFALLAKITRGKMVIFFGAFISGFFSIFTLVSSATCIKLGFSDNLIENLFIVGLAFDAVLLLGFCLYYGHFSYWFCFPIIFGNFCCACTMHYYNLFIEISKTLAVWIEDSIERVGALETWTKIIFPTVTILTIIIGAAYKVAKDLANKKKETGGPP